MKEKLNYLDFIFILDVFQTMSLLNHCSSHALKKSSFKNVGLCNNDTKILGHFKNLFSNFLAMGNVAPLMCRVD